MWREPAAGDFAQAQHVLGHVRAGLVEGTWMFDVIAHSSSLLQTALQMHACMTGRAVDRAHGIQGTAPSSWLPLSCGERVYRVVCADGRCTTQYNKSKTQY